MEARLIHDGSQDDPLMATVRCFADGDEEGHATRDNIRALVNRHAALHETIATLKEQLAEMTTDRDLWQEAHDDDCPNKAMVETLRAELARERERHQEARKVLQQIVNERDSELDMMTCGYERGSLGAEAWHQGVYAMWRRLKIIKKPAIELLEPAPVATGESK